MAKLQPHTEKVLGEHLALTFVDKSDYAVFSCTDDAGEVHTVPLALVRYNQFIYVQGGQNDTKAQLYKDGRTVQIVCVAENQTPKLKYSEFSVIKNDAKALANQVFTMQYKSAICTAKVALIENPQEKKLALQLLSQKYCAKYMSSFDILADEYLDKINVYRFELIDITAKSNKVIQAS
ncbi:MAG: pyridoxamine 5'-phosphate oxidase family protein [Neisseriaceae bacterium]|nr:pyridoxamine 5'-phosphate oxidase family protein [Neisseriaceae bacterium]MBQ9184066.1 pyridoxamine 5'-phosphate oxidase family protein [Neisseriaceae bacterium]MBQ9258767.1 pyridoxamine 5'-phosphate oxidase family protein [Neisseriaceae bacterium]MBQ9725084.1 pyridoxamine 5'-phosphate oxidase family protein [Neisseriaceae bacterium]MBR1819220.1 pyridoxamine 5'-phosphate oxidase family protein [Neisseriaceae bacterium]